MFSNLQVHNFLTMFRQTTQTKRDCMNFKSPLIYILLQKIVEISLCAFLGVLKPDILYQYDSTTCKRANISKRYVKIIIV